VGGVLGGILGVILTFAIASASVDAKRRENEKNSNPLAALDLCSAFIVVPLIAGLGGIVGAVAGAALGAGLATKKAVPSSGISSVPIPPSSAGESDVGATAAAAAPESAEEELARLRERIAELERQKRTGEPGDRG
jgi:hypothetical protein